MNRFLNILFFTITLLVFSACSTDEPNGGEIDPGKNVPDPENTITVSIYKGDNKTDIDGLTIGKDDYFSVPTLYGSYIIDMGEMKGLGNVTLIPRENWDVSARVTLHHGYVFYNSRNDKFYRLFVSNIAKDELGTITGYQIKYDVPFIGKNEPVEFNSVQYSFDWEGGEIPLNSSNSSFIPFSVNAENTNCYTVGTCNPSLWNHDAFKLICGRNWEDESKTYDVYVENAYGSKTKITISQSARPANAYCSILSLKEKYWQDTANYKVQIPNDKPCVLHGVITYASSYANHDEGCIILQDETAAIKFNLSNDYYDHYIGEEIFINIRGMKIGRMDGLMFIGGDGYLSALSDETFRKSMGYCESKTVSISPITSIPEILNTTKELYKIQSKLCVFDRVMFSCPGETFIAEMSTYGAYSDRAFRDESGNFMTLRVRNYSNFKSQTIPAGIGKVTGIVNYVSENPYRTGNWLISPISINDFNRSEKFPNPSDASNPSIGNGTANAPFTMKSVRMMTSNVKDVVFKAYPVGYYTSYPNHEWNFSAAGGGLLLLADSPDERNPLNCVIALGPDISREDFFHEILIFGSVECFQRLGNEIVYSAYGPK